MGFWSTIFAALRFRAGAPAVVTEPLVAHRIWLDKERNHFRSDAVTEHRVRRDSRVAHWLRVEAER